MKTEQAFVKSFLQRDTSGLLSSIILNSHIDAHNPNENFTYMTMLIFKNVNTSEDNDTIPLTHHSILRDSTDSATTKLSAPYFRMNERNNEKMNEWISCELCL